MPAHQIDRQLAGHEHRQFALRLERMAQGGA
jgi:hypothetical protein